jgi:hypothetical protein
MYEDVSAVTKVGFNNANTTFSVLTHRVLSGMEDKSRAPFHHRAKYRAEPLKDSVYLHRSTLIPSSTSPVTHFRSDHLTYFLCSSKVPHREESMGGHITKTMKTLQKVRLSRGAHIEAQYPILRRHGTRHLGSRPTQVPVSQRYDGQGTGCSASRTSGIFLSTSARPRHHRALVPASLEGIVCLRYLRYIVMKLRG